MIAGSLGQGAGVREGGVLPHPLVATRGFFQGWATFLRQPLATNMFYCVDLLR